jgi:hypothetical protein
MKFAWIENNQVRDICPSIPSDVYTPEIAALYTTEVNDDIVSGASLIDGVWTNKPVVEIEPIIEPKLWDVFKIREGLTLTERVKWDNDKTDTIKTAKVEFRNERFEADTLEILQLLVDAGDISKDSMDKILS